MQDLIRQHIHRDVLFRGQNHSPLDGILQLPDVARPVVVDQKLHRLGHKAELRLPGGILKPLILLAVLPEKMLHQQRDVVFSVTKGRQCDVDYVEPVIKILAEPPFFH